MDRRSFLRLELAMSSANKLAFAVTQLAKDIEEEKARSREAIVSAKMAAAPVVVPVMAAMATEGSASQEPPEKKAAVGGAGSGLADSWTVEEVVLWAEKNTSSFTAKQLGAGAISGAALVALKDLDAFVESPMDKRRLEYAISKLREPLEAKKREQEELQSRVLSGTFSAGPAQANAAPTLVQQQQAMGHGVFGHVNYSENGFMLEIENSGKVAHMPVPIVVSLDELQCSNVELESTERRFWVLPNVEVKLPQGGGGSAIVNPTKAADAHKRAVVLVAKAKSRSEAWSVTVKMSYKLAESAEDWVLMLDNEQKKRLATDFAAKIPTFAKLSPPELQLEIEAAKVQRKLGIRGLF